MYCFLGSHYTMNMRLSIILLRWIYRQHYFNYNITDYAVRLITSMCSSCCSFLFLWTDGGSGTRAAKSVARDRPKQCLVPSPRFYLRAVEKNYLLLNYSPLLRDKIWVRKSGYKATQCTIPFTCKQKYITQMIRYN